jgi:AraC family transcriptional regulator, alkane utilization regulator
MDALSHVLQAVELSGAVFLSGEFSAPWCVISQADNTLCSAYLPHSERVVSYHLIAEGCCLASLQQEPGNAIRLDAGDVLVVPQGDAHLLGSDLSLTPVPSAPLLARHVESHGGKIMRFAYGGSGPSTRMVCGFLTCDGILSHPLLQSLPRIFKVGVGSGAESAWLVPALNYAAAEASEPRPGGATVLGKLSELLFVHAVRRCLDSLPAQDTGWLAALHDRYVGPAMLRLHADPAYPWTVDALASEVGLSRSAFAQRFTSLLGQPPMQYLARWRLRAAARELRSGNSPLAELAGKVGYESEAAFSRAFKREFGQPPASWRASR